MRAIDQAALDLLASGRAACRQMILFEFGTGTYGFWTGAGILNYGGIDYIGAGALGSIEEVPGVSDLSSAALIVRLSAVPNSDLTPDVLAGVESEQYHQRPATVFTAYLDPDSGALISVERVYRGYVDRIEHDMTAGGSAQLVVYLESRARDHTKSGHRLRSDADQRLVVPDDGFYRHVATAGTTTIYWGRATPTTAT